MKLMKWKLKIPGIKLPGVFGSPDSPGGTGAGGPEETARYADSVSAGTYGPAGGSEGTRRKGEEGGGGAKRRSRMSSMLRSYAVWAVFVLAACLLVELFFFNNNHWHSPGKEITDYEISLGSGLEQTEYGTFLITDPDRAYIELGNLNAELHNLYLNIIDPASPAVVYSLRFTDSANASLRSLDGKVIVSGVPESRYVRLHLKGKSRNLRIYLHAQAGEELHIRKIRINVKRPLFLHPGRIVFLWLIGMLLVIFGPRSWIYTVRLNFKEERQRFLILAIIFVNMVGTSMAGRASAPAVWRELRDDRDYQEKEYELYAEALLEGHLWLNIRPPRYLTRMRNPYDRQQRDELARQSSEKVLWDAAYYNGRYYVYFGIVPALMSFLPWRLLTGRALPTWHAVLLMAELLWPAAFWFVYVLVRRHFRKTSLGVYLLLAWAFVMASGVIYLATFPVVYSVPFVYGIVFVVAGLALWIKGFGEDGTPYRTRMAAGSFLIALTVGCRPTMILTALLAFPIFWAQIRAGYFFRPKKDSALNTAAVILPFLPMGFFQMQINAARFGNPFDFGANYNLTVSDLTKKTFSIAKNIPALFQELAQPLHIQPQFPFISGVEVETEFQGYMFIDKMIGGFFALNLLALFCFWIFRLRGKMAKQGVFGLAACSFVLAAFLVELDVQVGGISQRYMIDYGWLLMLAAILAILTLLETTDTYGYYAYLKVILVLTAICVGINYLSVFSDGQAISVRSYNPELFYRIRCLIVPG